MKRPFVAITGDTSLCLGGSSTLYPTEGGIWTSSHPAIASVTNSGLVTGISRVTLPLPLFFRYYRLFLGD